MRPTIVVVADILPQNGPKMPLVDDDQVIQALSAECAYHAFGDGVRLGSPDRSAPNCRVTLGLRDRIRTGTGVAPVHLITS
jgi:hypothetical protein